MCGCARRPHVKREATIVWGNFDRVRFTYISFLTKGLRFRQATHHDWPRGSLRRSRAHNNMLAAASRCLSGQTLLHPLAASCTSVMHSGSRMSTASAGRGSDTPAAADPFTSALQQKTEAELARLLAADRTPDGAAPVESSVADADSEQQVRGPARLLARPTAALPPLTAAPRPKHRRPSPSHPGRTRWAGPRARSPRGLGTGRRAAGAAISRCTKRDTAACRAGLDGILQT
jgi:hypothetical protein